ncbi:MAG TPA: hypothetical protein VG992_04280 [Candidatus Saccharimonadales bacterium]|nr:hypothetical protein [Candidatus Saccharimonadales bacterium]
MTRWLSEVLQAQEPYFRLGLRRLEAANGHPNADIRFATQVQHETRAKLKRLGLDPHDTTSEELYHVLMERMKADDERLVKALRTTAALQVSAEGDVTDGLVRVLRQASGDRPVFAVKPTRLKALLKKQPPKKAMKRLGYRSLESFLKHEQPVEALTAAWLTEGHAWQRRYLEQYKQLKASDFETRQLAVVAPGRRRWLMLAAESVQQSHHNLLSFKELGALVVLPLPSEAPNGSATASLALGLHELNEIRAGSTFLKLSQVRSDFGQLVLTIATDEPRLTSELLDQPVAWRLIQQFYSRLTQHFPETVFGPHVEAEDMSWQGVEEVMAELEPSFDFWRQTAHLGWLHGHQSVSFNLVDVALNYCNRLAFEQRLTQHFQHSLWQELLLRYLKRDTVEQSVLNELQPAWAPAEALN